MQDTHNCKVVNVFQSEDEMLRYIAREAAYEAVNAWWGCAVEAVVAGKRVRGFVTGPYLYPKSTDELLWNTRGEFLTLYVVADDGELTEVEPVPENNIEIKGRLSINELRREGTPQSIVLVKASDKHRKFLRELRRLHSNQFF